MKRQHYLIGLLVFGIALGAMTSARGDDDDVPRHAPVDQATDAQLKLIGRQSGMLQSRGWGQAGTVLADHLKWSTAARDGILDQPYAGRRQYRDFLGQIKSKDDGETVAVPKFLSDTPRTVDGPKGSERKVYDDELNRLLIVRFPVGNQERTMLVDPTSEAGKDILQNSKLGKDGVYVPNPDSNFVKEWEAYDAKMLRAQKEADKGATDAEKLGLRETDKLGESLGGTGTGNPKQLYDPVLTAEWQKTLERYEASKKGDGPRRDDEKDRPELRE